MASEQALTMNLVGCVDAIKAYLDTFLAADPSTHLHLPFEEWFRLIMAFFILYKLSAGSRDIQGWDVSLCRETIDIETYLGQAIEHMRVPDQCHSDATEMTEGVVSKAMSITYVQDADPFCDCL
jgi:hypothetical protein